MKVDEGEASRLGLTSQAISTSVSAALLGVEAGEIRLDDRSIGVRVRAPDSVRFDPIQLASLPVVSPTRLARISMKMRR